MAPRQDALAAGGLVVLMLAAQLAHDRVVDPDGFFHVAQARRVFDGMPNLPLSIFGDDRWVDHQLGHHLLLAPFALVLPPILAAKLSAAVFAGGALVAMRHLLATLRVPHPGWAALLPVALSFDLLVRLQMPRTQSIALALLAVAVVLLERERHAALAVLAFAFAWTYQVSLLLLPVAALWAVVPPRPASAWRAPAAVAGGLAAGFLVHPHSPRTLTFLVQHVLHKVANRAALPVGTEWTERGLGPLVRDAWPGLLLLALVLGLAVDARRCGRALDRSARALALLAASATGLTLVATKFLEYSIPLSGAAFAVFLAQRRGFRALPRRLGAVLGAAVLALFAAQSARVAAAVRAHEPDPHRAEGAAAWLRAHVPQGERVYHFAWDDFPELVLQAPEYDYIVGLDPHLLALADPQLWELYAKIGAGWGRNPSKPIRERFGARWAILLLPYPGDPRGVLGADPGLRLAYEDPSALVYEVLPAM